MAVVNILIVFTSRRWRKHGFEHCMICERCWHFIRRPLYKCSDGINKVVNTVRTSYIVNLMSLTDL